MPVRNITGIQGSWDIKSDPKALGTGYNMEPLNWKAKLMLRSSDVAASE